MQVKGFAGAEYKSFPNREMADVAFHGQYEDYEGRPGSSQQWLFAPIKPIIPSICVDAACSGSPGLLEYQGVLTETGEQIFHAGPFSDGTNIVLLPFLPIISVNSPLAIYFSLAMRELIKLFFSILMLSS